ncbi:MAG: helix-turn-helix transcriptional regulator [Bacteroidales bacterium]|nr:helix-turn-helix transcriptional regulator [Bacteroidales bacterium]
MSKALNRINEIASNKKSDWIEDATVRHSNIEWSDKSFRIAVRILREIRRQKPINGMSQKKLADEMGVSPQYINKVVKGQENLTLETISKIEKVLGISLIQVATVQTSQVLIGQFDSNTSSFINKNVAVPVRKSVISFNEPKYLRATGTNG